MSDGSREERMSTIIARSVARRSHSRLISLLQSCVKVSEHRQTSLMFHRIGLVGPTETLYEARPLALRASEDPKDL